MANFAPFIVLSLLAVVTQRASATVNCSFASRMDKASIYQEPGHYFAYEHRLTCAGDLAAWHYCYYTAELSPDANSHWVRFQIWREVNTRTIQLIHSHHVEMELPPSNESFVCLRATVSEHTSVEVDDFLGVSLPPPQANPIPVIGSGVQGSSLHLDVGDSSDSLLLRRIDGLVLHADVEFVAPSSSATSRLQPFKTVSKEPNITSPMVPPISTPTSSILPSLTLSILPTFTSSNLPTPTLSILPTPDSSLLPTPTSSILTSSSLPILISSSVKMKSQQSSSFSISSIPSPSSTQFTSSLQLPSSTQRNPSSILTHFVVTSTASSVASYSSEISESAVSFTSSTSSVTEIQQTSHQIPMFSEERQDKPGATQPSSRQSATPTSPPSGSSSGISHYLHNWPFIVGLIIGAVLLILIVVVSVLLFLVASVRRKDDPDKHTTASSRDNIFTVVSVPRAIDLQEEAILDRYKILQLPPLLNPPTASTESTQPADTNTVYAAPHKVSPTSNSSVYSIFSSEEGNNVSAQPYETPLATPLSSRLNLFPSSSTLDTTTSEVITSKSPLHPQPNQSAPLTLDRLRVPKAKKPLPAKPPHQMPDKENRESPAYVLPERVPKGKVFPPEQMSADDEGYCTVRHSATLLKQANIDTSPQDMYCIPPKDERDILESLERMNITEIPRENIQIIGHIGKGEFGSVAKAYWKTKSREIEVAIKGTPRGKTDVEDRVKLLQEAAMMGQFRHPNVVLLHGIVTSGTSFVLVLGYLAKGDLRTHLVRMNRQTLLNSTDKLLTSYSQQVALGMHYLASKGFVHRDLAARNIFVSQNNTCKVGDFGMSRDLANAPYYISKGGKIPVRWTAPEAMYYHKYSTASDVWSYGCVLYEIWSLGRLPFKKYTNAEVLERLDSGYRLPPPPGTPRAIYDLMIQTWHPSPRRRPEFRNILVQLVRDESCLLHIPVSDASTSQQASQLGSPLTAGEYMYSDLQRAYLQQQPPSRDEEQYDSLMGRKYVLCFPTSSADIDYLYNDHNPPQKSFRSQLMTSDTESDYEELSGHY